MDKNSKTSRPRLLRNTAQTNLAERNDRRPTHMSGESRISTAFKSFFSEADPDEKREAIVIYRAPAQSAPRVRGRLRELKSRLETIKASAAAQRPIQKGLFESYHKAVGKGAAELSATSIGKNTLPVSKIYVTSKTLPLLAEQPNVVAVLPNLRIKLIQPKALAYETPAKQEAKDGLTWGLKHLEIPKLWEKTKGQNINVAVLDTGVHGKHPALDGRVTDFLIIDPLGNRIKTDTSFDSDQHGTHVCGTIAGGKTADGISIGVAPEANLFVGGVLVGNATLGTLVEGISWAVEKGADIISMSLGFPYYEPLFAELFKALIEQYGVLPVAAIGNENYGNSSSPGNALGALSVGAVEKLSASKVDVAFFSSGASLVFPGEGLNAVVTKPDVVAPGVHVYSSIPPANRHDGVYEYAYFDGTSMATPHVAGVAALLMAAKPTTPVDDIVEVLKSTAKHPDGHDLRPDNRWGYGVIRPMEALTALLS
jgi:subtilisin family serine protease